MKLYYIFIYVIIGFIVSASNNIQNTKIFNPLQKNTILELEPMCRMGSCSWIKIQSVDIIPHNNNTISMTIKIFGTSTFTENDTKKPQSWSEGAITKIYCSKTKPTLDNIILDIDKNRYTAQAEQSAFNIYFAACHSFVGDSDEAKKIFNY